MKKSLLFFLMLNLFALPLRAEEFSDTETYRSVYEKLQTGYIKPQSASDSALMVLKALPAVDRKLRVADDEKRVSLYYDARVVRSFLKPENPEDVNASLKLTIRVLKAAQNVSNKVKEKENGQPAAFDYKKASREELAAYFEEVLPNFDRDRVYPTDIKKLLSWYNLLVETGNTDFVEEKKADAEPEKEAAADKAETLCSEEIWPLPSYSQMLYYVED